MRLAFALDDARYSGALASPAMDTRESLGQRLLAAVIPAHFKDMNALHIATRIACSTIHAWKRGDSNPRWEHVEAIADLVGINAFRLVAGVRSTSGAAELVTRAHAPEWLTLAMRDFLLDRREFVA